MKKEELKQSPQKQNYVDLDSTVLLKCLENLSTSNLTEEKIKEFENKFISVRDLNLTKITHVAERVYRAEYSGEIVAVKFAKNQKRFERELKCFFLTNKSKHVLSLKNFGAYLETAIFPKWDYFFIMEWMPQTLDALLESKQELAWCTRLNIAVDIAKALKILGEKKILHRGMKSLNILLTTDLRAILADFDVSIMEGERADGVAGPAGWIIPKEEKYSHASDIYGYGLILWHLITRKLPYKIEDIFKEIPVQCPRALIELASACCHKEPKKRLKIDDIIAKLQETIEHSSQTQDKELKYFSPLPLFLQPFIPPNSLQKSEKEFKDRIIPFEKIQFLSTQPKMGDSPTKIYPVFYNNEICSLKWIGNGSAMEFRREVGALLQLEKCNNIPTLKGVGSCTPSKSEDSSCRHYFLVLEWMPQTLHTLLESKTELSWTIRSQIALKIAQGLEKLEEEQIIHLKLCSDEIWLSQDLQPKLMGLGHAELYCEIGANYKTMPSDWTASENTMSPAIVVFAFSKVLLHLLTRKYPLRTEEIPVDCPLDLIKLYWACCHPDPIKRLKLDDIILFLQKGINLQAPSSSTHTNIWATLFSGRALTASTLKPPGDFTASKTNDSLSLISRP